jgi:hypothetical protein
VTLTFNVLRQMNYTYILCRLHSLHDGQLVERSLHSFASVKKHILTAKCASPLLVCVPEHDVALRTASDLARVLNMLFLILFSDFY